MKYLSTLRMNETDLNNLDFMRILDEIKYEVELEMHKREPLT